ncbi:hypothetical protein FYA67_06430 [Bordetella holmesii]|nr:hypothetical protein D558_2756 [Bordetella holmesii 44057]AMD46250.1 hypothetical protein H558_12520 [Bordetella holmesii H558]AMD50520.1 hypothetical protein F783_005545 [Bordetella holmesii F627]AOB35143.1 hypothetical protein BBB42_06290 [Bordetella holmesii]EWM48982.1 hypothetical protein D557_2050 [Bordetella holmesii 70147]EXF87448.1 hypothetical protein D554_2708 [Bordetella holmesii 30539]KAK87076.1 hypothetical protein L496_0577 [Bordetella holmesii CDC-H572-BH]KCV02512.1 hypothe
MRQTLALRRIKSGLAAYCVPTTRVEALIRGGGRAELLRRIDALREYFALSQNAACVARRRQNLESCS